MMMMQDSDPICTALRFDYITAPYPPFVGHNGVTVIVTRGLIESGLRREALWKLHPYYNHNSQRQWWRT